jgi:transketolase
MAAQYAVEDAPASVALRLVIGPSPRHIDLPDNYELVPGRGVTLHSGNDALMFAYGPVMLNEALTASELLAEGGFGLQVVNMPWLNRVDDAWFSSIIAQHAAIYVLEDHAPVGGLGDFLLSTIVRLGLSQNRRFEIFGVEGWPACGTPPEALKYHGLDGVSLARRVKARSSTI